MKAELEVVALDASQHLLSFYRPLLADLGVVPAGTLGDLKGEQWIMVAGAKVASQTPARPFGMCIDAGGYPRPNPATVTIPVLLQPCQSETPSLYRQEWSFNDNANLASVSG